MSSKIGIFPPGSRWLYVELSASWFTLDEVVKTRWNKVVSSLRFKHLAKNGYFVRYMDKRPHLRLRFQLYRESDVYFAYCDLMSNIEDLISTGVIWDISILTYKREVLRYNIQLIDKTESLFFLDSMLASAILQKQTPTTPLNDRFFASLIIINFYLQSFYYSNPQRIRLLEDTLSGNSQIGIIYNRNKRLIGMKYREQEAKIFSLLSKDDILTLNDITNNEVNNYYMFSLKNLCHNLFCDIQKYGLDLDSLVADYIHMSMNRLFASNNNIYETYAYSFLSRYYRSMTYR